MRALREVMRMYRDNGLAVREVARLTGVARSTARDMISRFEKSGLAWPIPPETATMSWSAACTALSARSGGIANYPNLTGRQ